MELNKQIQLLEKLTGKKVILKEFISRGQLKSLESYLDRLFKPVDMDINFTNHFFDRVNDARNGKPIEIEELIELFKDTYREHKDEIPQFPEGTNVVITDMDTDINVPFVLQYDMKNHELDLISKTVMRKKNFMTSTPRLTV